MVSLVSAAFVQDIEVSEETSAHIFHGILFATRFLKRLGFKMGFVYFEDCLFHIIKYILVSWP